MSISEFLRYIIKFKKRLLSLTLAVLLITALAIPASAYSASMGRTWSGFAYSTSDTCNTDSFYCVIESASSEYTLKTDVTAYHTGIYSEVVTTTPYYGTSGTLIALNSATVSGLKSIHCVHFIGGTRASAQDVSAS